MYRNRKGYFSINTQAVCDADLNICSIVARWPGSVHDSTIFNNSLLKVRLENNYEDVYILGDSGYACKKYLLTPLLNPTTAAEENYNESHIKTRNVVERLFGVYKKRFPALAFGLRTKVETVLQIIVATAVLHNIANNLRDIIDDENDVMEDFDANVQDAVVDDRRNDAVRRALIITHFNR